MRNHSTIRAVCTLRMAVNDLPENVTPAKKDFANASTIAGISSAK